MPYMKCVYIFPTEKEAALFRKLRPHAEVVISGVGMAATAAAIASLDRRKHLFANDIVVLCGIAGAYDRSLEVCEVVEVVNERCVELPERFRQTYHQKVACTKLRRVSSNTVHGSGAEASGADIENMEGAALFAMAEVIGFRAVEIRAISNYVGDRFEEWNIKGALETLTFELIKIEDGE